MSQQIRAQRWDREGSTRSFSKTLTAVLISGCFTVSPIFHVKPGFRGSDLALGETYAIKPPLCGHPDDKLVHIPPEWSTFVAPKRGESYIDPVFGCRVTRLTDSSAEEQLWNGTHPSLLHHYSTLSPMNATDSMLFIVSSDGALRIIDTTGRVVVPRTKMPAINNGDPLWDAHDGDVFYYVHGKALHKGTISGGGVKSTVMHTFEEYRGIASPDAADLSQDGDHIALVGQNANDTMDVFVWSLSKKAKASIYTTTCKIKGSVADTAQPGCLHKLLLTANNLLAIEFAADGHDLEQGLRLWDGSKLLHLQDGTNHADTGYDLSGNPVFIASNNGTTLEGLKNPCPSGWGLDVRQLNPLSSAVCLLDHQPSYHVSYRGSASQPWVALSFTDGRKAGPELFKTSAGFQPPSSDNWQLYEDEIILARIDGRAIYRLAHARSRSAEGYFAEPHAAISRDGKYVIFTSTMAYPDGCPPKMHVPGECTDVYAIRVQ